MRALFPFAVVCALIALVFMAGVKRGEPQV